MNGADWLVKRDPSNVGLKRHFFGERSARGWTRVSVPNAWNATDVNNASMAGSFTWYRKDFRVPRAAATTWLLHFDNVRYRATVWLNGKRLGGHEGGYLAWELRTRGLDKRGAHEGPYRPWERRTRALDKRGVNRLVVRVDNRTRSTDLPPARLTVEGA